MPCLLLRVASQPRAHLVACGGSPPPGRPGGASKAKLCGWSDGDCGSEAETLVEEDGGWDEGGEKAPQLKKK